MQLVVLFSLCLAAISRMSKFIESIYYLHERLNGIAKNKVSSGRSDSLQRHTNCEILTLKDKSYVWGIVNKVVYYSESTFSESVPIVKAGASTYTLTTAGYLLKDLYHIKNGWVGLWRKTSTTTPWRVVVYDATFSVVTTYNLTCDQYTLQGKIYTYNAPYIWITYSHQVTNPMGYTGNYFFTKVNLTDSSVTFENKAELQYYDGVAYTWFNRHVLIGIKLYFFDELSFDKGYVAATTMSARGMAKHLLSYDGTYIYILYDALASGSTGALGGSSSPVTDSVIVKKVA